MARGGKKRRMSGDGVANLEELANARRLRVTAVIPPQYNPIRPRLRPPLVEPRRFHSSASTLSPPPPALRPPSRLRPAARFSARFHRSLSFLRLFAVAPRPITSSAPAPHPRRYASLFSFPASPFPPCSPNPPPPPGCLLIFRLLFLPSASSFLPRAALCGLIFSPFFLFPAISYSAPWE